MAIDDFGTGYSSLSYLREFAVDEVKLDQSFVRRITTRNGDVPIVTAILAMARGPPAAEVVAGVETAEEQAFLRAHECDEAQRLLFQPAGASRAVRDAARTGIPEPASRFISR